MSDTGLSHDTAEGRRNIERYLLAMSVRLLDPERQRQISEHVASCAECQQNLATFQRIPTDPGLSTAPTLLTPTGPGSEPATARRARTGFRGRGLAGRLVAGWAILATLLVVVFMVAFGVSKQDTASLQGHEPGIHLTGAPAQIELAAINTTLELRRGEATAAEPPVFDLAPGRQLLVISPLPLLGAPPNASASLTVLDSRDSVLVSTTCALGQLAGRAIPIDTGDRGFPAGRYSLKVAIGAAEGIEAREALFQFRIARQPRAASAPR